jgi:hypothetical protein
MGTRIAAGAAALSVGLLAVAAAPASASLSKSISQSQLNTLKNNLGKTSHLTYEAVYQGISGGKTINVTIAQSPPKSSFNFASGGNSGVLINNGTATYICSDQGGKETCISYGAGSSTNPFLAIENLFSSATAAAALASAGAELHAHQTGLKVVSGTSTFAGQSATCVTVSTKGTKTGKFCVTKKGVLAYSGTSSTQYFQLTKFSSSPPSSLFSLPAGATTITLPPGVSIP